MPQPPNPPRPGPQQPPYGPPFQTFPGQGQPMPPQYAQQPPLQPHYAPRPQPTAETRRDVEAAWQARLELGLDFEEHIAAGLAERVEQLAAYRAGELRHEAELDRRRDAAEQSGRGRQFALGIVSVVMGVPITAIAGHAVQQDGLTAIAISWLGLVGINAVHALGLRRGRRPR
jgi:hypothetical protein